MSDRQAIERKQAQQKSQRSVEAGGDGGGVTASSAANEVAPIEPEANLAPEEPPVTGTWIEIDAAALRQNLRELQRTFGPETTLCMVVKGNAYGHGYDPVVPIAEAAGVRDFAVFSAREAMGFLDASDGRSRLQVMGHADPRNLEWMCRNGIQPWINDVKEWEVFSTEVDRLPEPLGVHVEVETGMNRSGLQPENALRVVQEIWEHDNMRLEGVCTHLAGAEDSRNDDRLERQQERYHDFLARLEDLGIRPAKRHIASSAAALRNPDFRLDMVRVGIAAYGLWPAYEVRRAVADLDRAPTLRPVLSWKSRLLAVKKVPDGAFVGYGKSYRAEGETVVGVVSVGYADGFARGLSNQGYVLLRGKRASIIGNVNMNMVQVHLTHIPDATPGDEVTVVGREGDEEISVASFSDFNNVVNYEQMSRLSWEIPRRLRDGGTDGTRGGDPERDG